jgi:hypothetical protein
VYYGGQSPGALPDEYLLKTIYRRLMWRRLVDVQYRNFCSFYALFLQIYARNCQLVGSPGRFGTNPKHWSGARW